MEIKILDNFFTYVPNFLDQDWFIAVTLFFSFRNMINEVEISRAI